MPRHRRRIGFAAVLVAALIGGRAWMVGATPATSSAAAPSPVAASAMPDAAGPNVASPSAGDSTPASATGPAATAGPGEPPTAESAGSSATFGVGSRVRGIERGVLPPFALTGYVWPLRGARVTQPFGPSVLGTLEENGRLMHDGIDLATFCGDRILAAHDGLVLAAGRDFDPWIGWVGDLGPYVARLDAKHLWWTLPISIVTDDGNGYRSIYSHFWKVVVRPGQRVTAGQLIGYEGATGRATGCHLHYGLFNPLDSGRLAVEPAVVKRMLVPSFQVARVDPMLVLPPKHAASPPAPVASPGPIPSPGPGASPGG